jgi:hypothetical protein
MIKELLVNDRVPNGCYLAVPPRPVPPSPPLVRRRVRCGANELSQTAAVPVDLVTPPPRVRLRSARRLSPRLSSAE